LTDDAAEALANAAMSDFDGLDLVAFISLPIRISLSLLT
jgi:hypothetical protein